MAFRGAWHKRPRSAQPTLTCATPRHREYSMSGARRQIMRSSCVSLLLMHAGAAAAVVPVLDADGINEVMSNANQLVAVRFISSAGPSYDAVWEEVAGDFRGSRFGSMLGFGSVYCATQPAVCAARKIPDGGATTVKLWTGESFRKYTGQMDPQSLRAYLAKKVVEAYPADSQSTGQSEPGRQEQSASSQHRSAPRGSAPEATKQRRVRDKLYVHTEADPVWTAICTCAALVGCIVLGVWLRRPPTEAPATFVLIGSAAEPAARWPQPRSDGFVSVVRVEPELGR